MQALQGSRGSRASEACTCRDFSARATSTDGAMTFRVFTSLTNCFEQNTWVGAYQKRRKSKRKGGRERGGRAGGRAGEGRGRSS